MDASHASHKDDKKGKGLLSKGRYHEIETGLKKQCEPEQCKIMLDILKKVLNFDPNISTYNEKIKAHVLKRRQKYKEDGISAYEAEGRKAAYHKRKENKSI